MKRLIVCCDGSWNTPEMESPTNVVRLASALRNRTADGVPQIVYYDEGVGTHGPIDKIFAGAMGAGLDFNVREAYRFLAGNYEAGDEIYLFGFSRGAYTVRSLAGMIGLAGLLGRRQITEVAEAYELYRREKHRNAAPAVAFRSKHGTRVPPITLLGCWDTVGALGIPDKLPGVGLDERFNKRYRWVDTKLGAHVEHALHALAIDERRVEFEPTLMESVTDEQSLLQVWFPGDHGSVGGGQRHKEPLARIALEWMTEAIADLGLGLAIDTPFENLLPRDHNAYVSANRSPIYGRKPRNIAPGTIHDSALERFVDLPRYRESVSAAQRDLLGAAATQRAIRPSLRCPSADTVLGVGEHADVIVMAARQKKRHPDLVAGERAVRTVRGGVPALARRRSAALRPAGLAPRRRQDATVLSRPGPDEGAAYPSGPRPAGRAPSELVRAYRRSRRRRRTRTQRPHRCRQDLHDILRRSACSAGERYRVARRPARLLRRQRRLAGTQRAPGGLTGNTALALWCM